MMKATIAARQHALEQFRIGRRIVGMRLDVEPRSPIRSDPEGFGPGSPACAGMELAPELVMTGLRTIMPLP